MRELARIGAENAASAFSLLVDRTIEEGAVRAVAVDAPLDACWSTGVFFELEGCIGGLVGLLLREPARDAIVERLLGEDAKSLAGWCIESALTEAANILASHVASAIADARGERLLPSVPALFMQDAARECTALAVGRGAPRRFECELSEARGTTGGLLVFVPGEGPGA